MTGRKEGDKGGGGGVCIIAGSGALPRRVYESCRQSEHYRNVRVLALRGIADKDWLGADVVHEWTALGRIVSALERLRDEHHVDRIVMAGAVTRPSLSALMLGADRRTLIFIKRFLQRRGDDDLLRGIVVALEADLGFRVLGIEDVLQTCFAPVGFWGRHRADKEALQDISRAVKVAYVLGSQDVGQAVVAQQNMVLGVEGIEGTQNLIERCGALQREGAGGVLVKIKKPQQERRADLPVVGVETVRACGQQGFQGIAVEAEHVIVMNQEEMVAMADKSGLFVLGLRVADYVEKKP